MLAVRLQPSPSRKGTTLRGTSAFSDDSRACRVLADSLVKPAALYPRFGAGSSYKPSSRRSKRVRRRERAEGKLRRAQRGRVGCKLPTDSRRLSSSWADRGNVKACLRSFLCCAASVAKPTSALLGEGGSAPTRCYPSSSSPSAASRSYPSLVVGKAAPPPKLGLVAGQRLRRALPAGHLLDPWHRKPARSLLCFKHASRNSLVSRRGVAVARLTSFQIPRPSARPDAEEGSSWARPPRPIPRSSGRYRKLTRA